MAAGHSVSISDRRLINGRFSLQSTVSSIRICFVFFLLFYFYLITSYSNTRRCLLRCFVCFFSLLPWCLPSFVQNTTLFVLKCVCFFSHSCPIARYLCCSRVLHSRLTLYEFDYCRLDDSIAEKLSCYSHGKNSGNQQWQQKQQLKYFIHLNGNRERLD